MNESNIPSRIRGMNEQKAEENQGKDTQHPLVEEQDDTVQDPSVLKAKLKLRLAKAESLQEEVELQCPKCSTMLKAGHILCIDCGVNAETGKRIRCKKGYAIAANTSFDRNEHVGLCRRSYVLATVVLWLSLSFGFVYLSSPESLTQIRNVDLTQSNQLLSQLPMTLLVSLGAGVLIQWILDAQRMRNTGSSGWLIIWYFMPLGMFWVLYRLCCCPEDYRFNHHLDNAGKALLFGALVLPTFAVVSLLTLV